MKLLDARVNGMPRQVNTKYGEKAVLDVATSEGNFTVWRPAGDIEVLGRRNGERVSIAIDAKGKASLVEHAGNSPAVGLAATTAGIEVEQLEGNPANLPPSRSAEIADYIERLGKLYGHCLSTAAGMPTNVELGAPQVKDVATTLFTRAAR
jgi:hypothetical protein